MELTVSTQLTAQTCPDCGGVYAIAQEYKDEARKKGGFKQCWTCPYCKTVRGFGEGEADRLRAQIAELERSRKWEEQQRLNAEREANHFRKSRDGIKGALAKERKRVGNGVCPCCNRTFVNLQRHMVTKHPKHQNADPLNHG